MSGTLGGQTRPLHCISLDRKYTFLDPAETSKGLGEAEKDMITRAGDSLQFCKSAKGSVMHDTACDSIVRLGTLDVTLGLPTTLGTDAGQCATNFGSKKSQLKSDCPFRDVLAVNVMYRDTQEYPGRIIMFVYGVRPTKVKGKDVVCSM